jgi:hypothetical protein
MGAPRPRSLLRAPREIARSLLEPLRRIRAQSTVDDDALSRRLASIAPADPSAEAESPPVTDTPPQEGEDHQPVDDAPRLGGWQLRRPSALGAAILAVALAVAFVGMLSYYGARKFTRDAADTRASEEGQSLAVANAYTATGDAFNGYLQMLRYADDPVIASPASSIEQRLAALDYLVHLNTNKIASLSIVGIDGAVLATTDPSIPSPLASEALNRTRGNLAPTNSDIILPEGAVRGYVEFTSPLKDGAGVMWGILYGRADPDVLWATTLRSSVDGSRNVILNSEGLFAAGVPEEQLRQPWRGAPLDNGSVRADIVGVDSICGLGPIGRDSQIDHGWHVASCLPASLIQVEADRAMGQQLLLTSAGAVLAVVLAAGLLRFALDGESPAPASVRDDDEPAEDDPGADAAFASLWPEPETATPAEAAPQPEEDDLAEPPPPAQPPVVVVADVEATQLIDAYERRAARVSDQLRESVQARLMIAATQASEAFRLVADDPDRAADLHASAMDELDAVRNEELRSLAQQLHPALTRLGLPAALRTLAKEFEGALIVRLDVDTAADAVRPGEGRAAVDAARRLAVFRAARAALDALVAAGADSCALGLSRDNDRLHLRIETPASLAVDARLAAADALAFEAYGGHLAWQDDGDGTALVGELPAPPADVEDDVPFELDEATDAGEPPVTIFAAPLDAPGDSLAASLRELALELAGEIEFVVSVESSFDESGILPGDVSGELRMLAAVATRAMAAAGAATCRTDVRLADGYVLMSIHAPTAVHDVPATPFDASRDAIEARGGTLTVGAEDGEAVVVAAVPIAAMSEEPPAVIQIGPTAEPEAA